MISRYSIILPVRNGGEYVKECVHSILSQTFNNFNLHILDNCSTDGTLEWVQSLTDDRIKIHSAQNSLTIEESWARILQIPKNEFITLIGHDDILSEKYLEVMDKLIAKHPGASLYQAHFNYIDSKGKIIRACKPMKEKENAEEFLTSLLTNHFDIMGTGFMMRSADYDMLGGIPAYPNLLFADFELFVNLTRKGYKATSLQNCFSFRLHQSTTSVSPDIKIQLAFERFVYFLNTLKKQDKTLDKLITAQSPQLILFYCKGLSHRLLRTPAVKRGNLSVSIFIEKCKSYAQLLSPDTQLDPLSVFSIRLAKVLDSSFIGRNLFLAFKKMYASPILK